MCVRVEHVSRDTGETIGWVAWTACLRVTVLTGDTNSTYDVQIISGSAGYSMCGVACYGSYVFAWTCVAWWVEVVISTFACEAGCRVACQASCVS